VRYDPRSIDGIVKNMNDEISQQGKSATPDHKAAQREAARQLLDLGQLSTDHLSQLLATPDRRKTVPWGRLIVGGFAVLAALLAVSLATYQEKPGHAAVISK